MATVAAGLLKDHFSSSSSIELHWFAGGMYMQPGAGAQMNMYGGTVSAGGMANGFMQQAPAMSLNMGMQQVSLLDNRCSSPLAISLFL